MNLEFYRLSETILNLANGKKVLYFPNPGNWGDGLIRAGTLAFFKHFGIAFDEISLEGGSIYNNSQFLKAKLGNRLLVVGGGGAWCSHYPHLADSVANIQRRFGFKNIIVLPSTYDRRYDIDNVTFCRRDHFLSKEHMPKALFCHDMAFFLGRIETSFSAEKGVGNMFRTDIETSGKIDVQEDNYDLSAQGNEKDAAAPFFYHINQYEVINTDRLHVSVAGSLLGKKVRLYEGSYGKNKSIYLSSMKSFFPNTEFMEFN